MLRKINLHKNVLKIRSNKIGLFFMSHSTYTSESLEILQTKVNRNSQEFQVIKNKNINYLNRIIIKI